MKTHFSVYFYILDFLLVLNYFLFEHLRILWVCKSWRSLQIYWHFKISGRLRVYDPDRVFLYNLLYSCNCMTHEFLIASHMQFINNLETLSVRPFRVTLHLSFSQVACSQTSSEVNIRIFENACNFRPIFFLTMTNSTWSHGENSTFGSHTSMFFYADQ